MNFIYLKKFERKLVDEYINAPNKYGVFDKSTHERIGVVKGYEEHGHNYTDGTPLFKTYSKPHILWSYSKDGEITGWNSYNTRKEAIKALLNA